MVSNSFRLFQYGEHRFKLVFYKCDSLKKKSRFEKLADLYEIFDITSFPNMGASERYALYEKSHCAYMRKNEGFVSDSPLCENEKAERLSQSISRTKSRVYELAMCNKFRFFCTLTLNEGLKDRFDLKAFSKDFGQFIRNFNRDRSEENKVKYLIIPEKHKNGAWHAHGLLQGLTDDDLIKNEYGYLDWVAYRKRFGFISLSAIRDTVACSSYITKYITKDVANSNREAFGHLYFASQGLKRRQAVTFGVADSNTFPNEFEFENEYVKISWFNSIDDVENFFNKR
jgi:hypothetical protein